MLDICVQNAGAGVKTGERKGFETLRGNDLRKAGGDVSASYLKPSNALAMM